LVDELRDVGLGDELVGARQMAVRLMVDLVEQVDGGHYRCRSHIPFELNEVSWRARGTSRDTISQDVGLDQKVPVTTLTDLDHIDLELAEGSGKFWKFFGLADSA
jgi:hypothetical protein